MGIIVIIAFLVYSILVGYVIVRMYMSGAKMLALSAAILISLSATIGLSINQKLSYPIFFMLMFLFGNILLLVSIVITKKSRGKDYALFILAFIFSLGISSFGTFIFYIFREEVLFKQELVDGVFLNYTDNIDNFQRTSFITIENPLYIERKLSSKISDAWVTPDEVILISFKDSIIKYSIKAGGIKELIEIDLRFDYVDDLINGVSIVRLGDKIGAIDSTRKIIIPIGKYQSLTDNYGSLMLAQKDGKWGYISKEDKVAIPFTFSGGGNFLSDSTTVQIGTKYYYINKKGKLLREYKP